MLFVSLALAVLFPTVEYITILQGDSNVSLAYPAAIWAGTGLIFLFGALAYYLMMPILLGLHAGISTIVGAAMVITYTQVFFSADARCDTRQSSIVGCESCPCAATSACNAVRHPSQHEPCQARVPALLQTVSSSLLCTSSIVIAPTMRLLMRFMRVVRCDLCV